MDDVDWEGIFFGLGVLILGTVLVVAVLIQIGAFSRARIARRDDKELRAVVERYEQLAGSADATSRLIPADHECGPPSCNSATHRHKHHDQLPASHSVRCREGL